MTWGRTTREWQVGCTVIKETAKKQTKETHTHSYFKELAYAIMEAVKLKICRVGLQTKDPRKNQYCSLSSKAFSWWNSLWLRRG